MNNLDKDGTLEPAEEEEEEGAARKRARQEVAQEESARGEGEGAEESEEACEVHAPKIPDTPSRAQVLQHRLTHRPFRSWCPHCVRGKGRADQHRKSSQKDTEGNIPKLASDYFFIGQRRPAGREEREREEDQAEKEGQTPIIVLKDTKSKSLFAHVCPRKGAHDAVVTRLVADLNTLGYNRVLVRTDGEPAILDLWAKVKEQWGGELVKVESMAGDHDTNGDAEQAVQKVEDEVRTWLDATNDSIKSKIPPTHDLLAWIVEHACSVDRRTAVGGGWDDSSRAHKRAQG